MRSQARDAVEASFGQWGVARGLAALVYALIDGEVKITIDVNLRDVTRENEYPTLPKEDLR
jgi:hypothetical protein